MLDMNVHPEEQASGDSILVVDDEPSVLSSLYRALRSEPWEIVTELSGEQALQRMRERPFKVVISDERMARMQGTEFLSTIKVLYPQTVRILLTGNASLDSVINIINYGEVFRYLTKPWDSENLILIVRAALHKYDRELKMKNLFRLFGDHPELVPHIEERFPGISRVFTDSPNTLTLPVLSDEELKEIMLLLGPIDDSGNGTAVKAD